MACEPYFVVGFARGAVGGSDQTRQLRWLRYQPPITDSHSRWISYRGPAIPAVARADACVNGTVKPGGSGGDYFLCQGGAWLHVVPTFDADGYGPNQPLRRCL